MVAMLGWMIKQIMHFVVLPEIAVQLSKFINQRMWWQSFCGIVTLMGKRLSETLNQNWRSWFLEQGGSYALQI